MSTTTTGSLSSFFAIKAKLKKEFAKPMAIKDDSNAKLRTSILFNYLMELREVELKLDQISSKDILFANSEAIFHRTLNKFDNYDEFFNGDYVKLFEVYNYDLNNTTKWVVWCKKF